MPTLLIVHHTTSPSLHAMYGAVHDGATNPDIEGVDVVARPALGATAVDALDADGYLLGSPANLGYISGALKHFFDQIYYPCLEATVRRPYGLFLHGNSHTTRAIHARGTSAHGLQWRQVKAPVMLLCTPNTADLDACWEL